MKVIACDLDGTASEYHPGDARRWCEEGQPNKIGRPIPGTIARIKAALAKGYGVWIFCARLSGERGDTTGMAAAICAWTIEHVGKQLPATATKLERFDEFWDDKAVRIAKNQGASGYVIGSLWHELGQGLDEKLESTIRAPSSIVGNEG